MAIDSQDAPLIRGLMKTYCDRLSMGAAPFDLTRAASMYVNDERFTAYDLAPPTSGYIGWQAYADGWRRIMQQYAYFEMQYIGEIYGGRDGNVIWSLAPFQVVVKARAEDPPVRKDGRVSLVWLLQGDEWRIVHEHVSATRTPGATTG